MDQTLQTILTVVIIPVLPTLAAFIISYLKKKTAELEANTNNAELNKYISILEDVVSTSVTSVSQTYVDALKKSGTFDENAQVQAFNEAKMKILTILSEDAKQALTQAYGDINALIENKIEQYVNRIK